MGQFFRSGAGSQTGSRTVDCIPSGLQRLLFQGKQLDDLLPLSFYSITRNNSLVVTLRLRGGAGRQSSSPFSYKDAVHSEIPKPLEALKPKPFLVDKIEEVPSVEITHEDLATQLQEFAERAIICRFNGLWPRSRDLGISMHGSMQTGLITVRSVSVQKVTSLFYWITTSIIKRL